MLLIPSAIAAALFFPRVGACSPLAARHPCSTIAGAAAVVSAVTSARTGGAAPTAPEPARNRMASVVTKPFSWSEVKDIVSRGKTTDAAALGLLGRCEADLQTYRTARARILEEYSSTTDSLRARLFGSPTLFNGEGKLIVDAGNDSSSRVCHICIMPNEYPYYLEPGIEHFNIWSSTVPLPDETVERLIMERLPCEDSAWFVNPPQFQSIKTIWHAHVMVKGLKEGARVGAPGESEVLDL